MGIDPEFFVELLKGESGSTLHEDFFSRTSIQGVKNIVMEQQDCFRECKLGDSDLVAKFHLYGRCPFHYEREHYLERVVLVFTSLKLLYPKRKIHYHPDWLEPEMLPKMFDNTTALSAAICLMESGDLDMAREEISSSLKPNSG